MTKTIVGAEYPLSKIFSSEFEFLIPPYQRPYAWEIEQATRLLDDILSFSINENDGGYFLGTIVLIKTDNLPRSEIIDGQQRLTTLTILLATMACSFDEAYREDIRPYIIEPGKVLEGIQEKPRLSLRERDRTFFSKYIQDFRLKELMGIDTLFLINDSQRNIQSIVVALQKAVEDAFATKEDLEKFVNFLLTRCFIVVVSTPNQTSAFRIFSVMNSRGIDLQPTDIVKADIIGKIDTSKEQQAYNERWEEIEVTLTRNGFNELFGYIRMIYTKRKAKHSLLEEFIDFVLTEHLDSKAFIADVLEPYARALKDIRSQSYRSSKCANIINNYFGWLNRVDNSDWLPPAILFLKLNYNSPDLIVVFFRLLERLASYIHICCIHVNDRILIYAEVIQEIQDSKALNMMARLNLNDGEKRRFKDALNGNIYEMTSRRRNYLILRLDAFISDGVAVYAPTILTIEHVLPQSVSAHGQWAQWWPDAEEQKLWVHRIANLVPLNRKKNLSAQNFDFKRKRIVYFGGASDVSSFVLTSQVLGTDEWTPEVMKARQKFLLDILKEKWALEESEVL